MPIFTTSEANVNQMMKSSSENVEIAISGVSGKFIESKDIEQYAINLMNGVNEENNCYQNQSAPKSMLDSEACVNVDFIGVESQEIMKMDLEAKKLVECAYDAIFDAGVNPAALAGSKTAVLVGTCNATDSLSDVKNKGLSSLLGRNVMMHRRSQKYKLADQVCNILNLRGPITVIEDEQCSSLLMFDEAVKYIQSGRCDQVIVCGIDRLDSAPGVKETSSSIISCVFIQKSKDCKRLYAQVLDSRLTAANKIDNSSSSLIKSIYAECKADPSHVTFVENYCNEPANESQELTKMTNVLASSTMNRSLPLYVCSENMSKECQQLPQLSGIIPLVNMIVAIQAGVIPASASRPLKVVSNGAVKTTVQSNAKLEDGLVVLNAVCGIEGVHILLKPNCVRNAKMTRSCIMNSQVQKMPHLFTLGARTQQGLEELIKKINPVDLPVQCLLESMREQSKVKAPVRGFCVFNDPSGQSSPQIKQVQTDQNKPVYCLFSGILTEWQGVCKEMMSIEAFKQSIEQSALCLKQHGIDLVNMLISSKQDDEKSPMDSLVAITAIHIALIDCLTEAGIKADGLIGHSVGELACAYADKCLTAQETIEIAYQRGKCIEDANLPVGGMAIVCGLTWEEAQQKCSQVDAVPSSHNGEKCVTLSGSKKSIQDLIKQLNQTEGIKAREVDCSDIALHSHFMTSIAPQMKQALEKVITNPKKRSQRWISTSIPEQRWNTDLAQTASADYLVNSFCSPALLKEALEHVASNAIVVEIGPSTILDMLIEKNLSQTSSLQASLMKPNVANQLVHFWTQLGLIYIEGVPAVDPMNLLVPGNMASTIYPVPVNTKFISNLAKLTYTTCNQGGNDCSTGSNVHSRVRRSVSSQVSAQCQQQQQQKQYMKSKNILKEFSIDVNTMRDSYLLGHRINGECVLPVSAYVYFVWKTLAELIGCQSIEDLPVQLKDIECHQLIPLNKLESVCLTVNINRESGEFTIASNQKVLVCNGQIQTLRNKKDSMLSCDDASMVEKQNVYKMLKQRGHDLSGQFQSIVRSSVDGKVGEIEWIPGHWIALLDGMMQMNILGHQSSPITPILSEISIKSITINPSMVCSHMNNNNIEYDESPESWSMHHNPQLSHRSHDESFEVLSLETTASHPIKNVMKKHEMAINNSSKDAETVLPVVLNPANSTVTCPGVQICNIVCSHRNSSSMSSSTNKNWRSRNSNQVEFVSYIKTELSSRIKSSMNSSLLSETNCTVDQKTKDMFSLYLSKCKQFTELILERIECPMVMFRSTPIQDNAINQMSQQMMKGGRVLQLLSRAAMIQCEDGEEYLNEVRHLFLDNATIFKAIQNDQFINSLAYDCNYKAIMDTVLENINCGQKTSLKVLEVSSSFCHCYGVKLDKIIRENYPDVSVDYKFASVFDNPNEQEILENMNNELSFPVKMVEWNLLRNGKLNKNVPSHLHDYDLVLFNTSLQILMPHCQSASELKHWISACTEQLIQPEGFVMVHEFTRNFESMAELCNLEQIVLSRDGQRNHTHKLRTENDWRQIVEQTGGLIPVSIKTDMVLSSVMLYHNECQVAQRNVKCVDIDQQGWINECKEAMSTRNIKRVLLISETMPDKQILAQINQLRQISQGGHKLRCLFATDSVPVKKSCLLATLDEQETLSPEMPLDDEQILEQVIKADLFMNVFSCGKWGSIHNVDDSDHFYVDQAQHKKIPRKWTSTLSDLNEDQLSQYQHPNSLQRCVSAHQNNVKQLMPRQCIKILNQINPSAYHQIPVVIIHPLEGHVNMCRNLANLLKYPVIGVQYSKEAMKYESIRELAQYYWKQIQSHFGCNKRVHLCGYGFGAMVALEMADLKVNRCASLILLDSGKPCVSNYIMMATSNMKNKAKIENEALFGFACTYIQPVSKFELMGAIMECNTLAQRINLVVNLLMEKSQFKFDRADLKDAACSYVIKCMMSEDLMPVCALRFPEVILIKASNQETELEDLIRIKKSKNVMGHCNVETHIIGCDVRSMLDGQNCKHVADIMNENLIRFI